MFEQFLKSGDYAFAGMPMKRARNANINPEDADDQDDDGELAFKDITGGDPEKRAKTEAQFQDFMKFLAEQDLDQGAPDGLQDD